MLEERKRQFNIINYVVEKLTDDKGEFITNPENVKLVEKEVLLHLKNHPSNATLYDSKKGLSLGMICALFGMEEVVLFCLDNDKAKYQQSSNVKYLNYNLGMFAAKKGMLNATLKSLNCIDTSYHQNYDGQNIGMLAAEAKMEEAVIKALNNVYATTQKDKNGNNIGMYAANNKLERAVIKALDDSVAAIQQNNDGDTMGIISARNGLFKAAQKAQKDSISGKQANKKGETIDSILKNNMKIM